MATYNNHVWDEWIRAVLTGDRNAYRLLLNELRPWLAAYYRKRVHPSSVDDLVQETLMTLHRKKQTFDERQAFRPWMAAIARHRWIDHMRSTLRHVDVELDEDMPAEDQPRDESARHDVRALLKLIPPAQAEVVEMVKLQEMTIEEVSKKTGHSPSSVKIMVHRGMKRMRAAVEEVHDE